MGNERSEFRKQEDISASVLNVLRKSSIPVKNNNELLIFSVNISHRDNLFFEVLEKIDSVNKKIAAVTKGTKFTAAKLDYSDDSITFINPFVNEVLAHHFKPKDKK